jgi:mannose-6-phosphate isomerase-like protein (cupin superfamily)
MKSGMWSVEDVLNRVKSIADGEEPYLEPFEHGTMQLGMYAPRAYDPQTPHEQDELYFVVSGSGIFVHGEEKTKFNKGDALFVAAGVIHRFEDFTDDFSAWVVFWGKQGGETNEV